MFLSKDELQDVELDARSRGPEDLEVIVGHKSKEEAGRKWLGVSGRRVKGNLSPPEVDLFIRDANELDHGV